LIKRASSSDISTLVGISQRSFESPWSVASFEAEFMKDYSHTYLFVRDRMPVAYLIVWVIKDEGEIVMLAVDKGWRKNGIGSFLLKKVMDSYPDVKSWNIEVDQKNTIAIHVYEKFSFKKTRTIANYYGAGKDAIQMTKKVK
jgi:ribosomal-protein-alanine acetyltransferase